MKSISQALAERLTFEQIQTHITFVTFLIEVFPNEPAYSDLLALLIQSRQIKREEAYI